MVYFHAHYYEHSQDKHPQGRIDGYIPFPELSYAYCSIQDILLPVPDRAETSVQHQIGNRLGQEYCAENYCYPHIQPLYDTYRKH